MEDRIGRLGQGESQIRGEEKRSGRLVDAAEISKERAEWRWLQQRNLSILVLLRRKSGLGATEKAVGKYARAAFVTRKRNEDVCPNHQIVRWERVKVSTNRTLVRKREIRAIAWGGENGLHGERRRVPRKKGIASKESLPRTSRRKHERVSGCKSSPGRFAESWFHSKSGQT